MKLFISAVLTLLMVGPALAQRGGGGGHGGGGSHGGGGGGGGRGLTTGGGGRGGASQGIRPGRAVLPTPTRAAVGAYRGFGGGGRGFFGSGRGFRNGFFGGGFGNGFFGNGFFGTGNGLFFNNGFSTTSGVWVNGVFIPLSPSIIIGLNGVRSFGTLAEFNAAVSAAGFESEQLSSLPTVGVASADTQQVLETQTDLIPVTKQRLTTVETKTSVGATIQGQKSIQMLTPVPRVMAPCPH